MGGGKQKGKINMTQSELKELLKNDSRYNNFIVLDKPVKFKEKFANKNAEVVQLHSIYIGGKGEGICGLCGQCSWKDNILSPLDGDTYTEDMTIYGYEWWSNKEKGVEKGLDILVYNDW